MLWATLAVPIVIFYLLKIRLRRVPVATAMFWEQVFEEKQPRAIWRQLRHILSLLLQLLFLGMLIFALADPRFSGSDLQQQRTIVVLDTSASMQAVGADGTVRLDTARKRVRQIIASLRNNDEMALIIGGNRAAVVCGLTSHQRTLQDTLENIAATDGPTHVTQAVELGRRLLADHVNSRIVVVTDGCLSRGEEAVKSDDDLPITWSLVGESVGNVAITKFQVRRSVLDPIGYQVLLEVANQNDQPVNMSLDLTLNEILLDVLPLSLQPGEVRLEIFEKTSTGGGVLTANIIPDQADANSPTVKLPTVDALAVDNTAYAVLPSWNRIPVTLVTDGNWFLQQVLEATEIVELTVTDQWPVQVADNSVLVLHRQVPEQLPVGRIFVVQPQTATDLWDIAGDIEQPLVAEQDETSDLLKFVRLDNVLMPEAKQLVPKAQHETLVEAISGAPLYVRFARPQGDVLVLTVNPDLGDLPLRTAFPILFTNALSWFSAHKGEYSEAVATGESANVRLPMELLAASAKNNSQLNLTSPMGSPQTIRVTDGSVLISGLDRTGVWTVNESPAAEPSRGNKAALSDSTVRSDLLIACNLSSRQESDLRPSQFVSNTDIAAAGYVGRPIWFYAVIGAFALLILEWLLFQRRWIN